MPPPPPPPPEAPSRFIPFRRADIVDELVGEEGLQPAERDRLRAFARRLSATFHVEFRDRLEGLKDDFAPFAHDPDTRVLRTYDPADRDAAHDRLTAGLSEMLEAANFETVPRAELEGAYAEESLLQLRVAVDFDDIEHMLVHRRGVTRRVETVKRWFGLRREERTFTNYEKVLVLVTLKDEEHFNARGSLGGPLTVPGSTVLKLFGDVPRGDLGLLFPNARMRMRPLDKLLIGVPAAVSGVVVVATKLLTTLGLAFGIIGFWLGLRKHGEDLDERNLLALALGAGALGGYVARQWTKFKNRKLEFMNALARNLYFRNLDNDVGVLGHLLDAAEEEETKEALLSWWFLRAADRPLTQAELDAAVEAWFVRRWDVRLDFHTGDGLAKLRRLDLVEDAGEGRLSAVPMDAAMRRIDERWDAYFTDE